MSQHSKTTTLRNSASSVYSKSLMVAIAAFALTASGAQAFTGEALVRAGLTDNQRVAFEVARELRLEGNITGARDLLVEAGIDEQVIERVRTALSETKHASKEAGLSHKHHKPASVRHLHHPELTSSQQAAFAAAQSANDRDTMEAILEEAGIRSSKSGHGPHTMRDGRVLD